MLVSRLESQHAPVVLIRGDIKIAIRRSPYVADAPVQIVQQFFLADVAGLLFAQLTSLKRSTQT
jgi:hypothetical protein